MAPAANPSNDYGEAQTEAPTYSQRNPFDRWDEERMDRETSSFVTQVGLEGYVFFFTRAGKILLDPEDYQSDSFDFTDIEKRALGIERQTGGWSRFRQCRGLWKMVLLCSMAAAVQGWDESAVNGAQVYYSTAFGIGPQSFEYGLVNSAPYLCCVVSCMFTYPLNKALGRRWTIFLTCIISFVSCLGQAFVQSWHSLLAARIILGLGIGPKSATVPIYSAECAPANIRGSLVMMWQVFTAMGIMLGYAMGLAFHNIAHSGDGFGTSVKNGTLTFEHNCTANSTGEATSLLAYECSANWRFMLASPMVLPIFVFLYVMFLPESPRWLLGRAHHYNPLVRGGSAPEVNEQAKVYYRRAFQALRRLRPTEVQAARDVFRMHWELRLFEESGDGAKSAKALFTERRSQSALLASVTCMFFQQFCGVNVLAYYSTTILLRAGYTPVTALSGSLGFGVLNFVFALPAFWLIDLIGRRALLLGTFPFMAASQALIAIAFGIDKNMDHEWSRAVVLTGIYLFAIAYSPGEGPVPFVYAAESLPLYNRDIGMGIVTAINWGFNFLVSITWTSFVEELSQAGAFAWYAAWCIVGEVIILLIVPETKNLTLEELTKVFEKPAKYHARLGLIQARSFVKWCAHPRQSLAIPQAIEMDEQEVQQNTQNEGTDHAHQAVQE